MLAPVRYLADEPSQSENWYTEFPQKSNGLA